MGRILERLLLLVSVLWLTAVLYADTLVREQIVFHATCWLVAANFLISMWFLIRRRRILILLNLLQLCLFCLLNYQVYCAFGTHHFVSVTEPRFYDWIQLTAVHLFRAVDILDFPEEYGIQLQHLKHHSYLSGAVLVAMHWTADIFLIGLLVHRSIEAGRSVRKSMSDASWRVYLWRRFPSSAEMRYRAPSGRRKTRNRRGWLTFAALWTFYAWRWTLGLLIQILLDIPDWILSRFEGYAHWFGTLKFKDRGRKLIRFSAIAVLGTWCIVFLGCAYGQSWRGADWLLWPVDNFLRTLDLGDMMHIFHWRLHRAPSNILNATLAVTFRLFVALAFIRWLARMRLIVFRGFGSTLDDLIKVLDTVGDDDAARAAVAAIADLGQEAIPTLRQSLLTHPWSHFIRRATEALSRIGGDALLGELLRDKDENVRCAAATGLAIHGTDKRLMVRLMVRLLSDPTEKVRHEAALQLTQMKKESAPVLLLAIAEQSNTVREMINKAGRKQLTIAQGVHMFVQALGEKNTSVRWAAAIGLGILGSHSKPAVVALVQALSQPDKDVCKAAAEALGKFGPEANEAVPALIAALDKKNLGIQFRAIDALGKIGPRAKQAVSALSNVFSNNAVLRECAAVALGAIGPEAKDAVPILTASLMDQQEKDVVRWTVAEALGRIGPAANSAVPALIEAMRHHSENIRWHAARALGQIGDTSTSAISALINALADNDIYVRRYAAQSLGDLGQTAKEATPALMQALNDRDLTMRGHASDALKKIDPTAVSGK